MAEVSKDKIAKNPSKENPYGVCTLYPNNSGTSGYDFLPDEQTAFEHAEFIAQDKNVGVAVLKVVGIVRLNREVKTEKVE